MLDVQEITSRAEKKLLENDSNPEGYNFIIFFFFKLNDLSIDL